MSDSAIRYARGSSVNLSNGEEQARVMADLEDEVDVDEEEADDQLILYGNLLVNDELFGRNRCGTSYADPELETKFLAQMQEDFRGRLVLYPLALIYVAIVPWYDHIEIASYQGLCAIAVVALAFIAAALLGLCTLSPLIRALPKAMQTTLTHRLTVWLSELYLIPILIAVVGARIVSCPGMSRCDSFVGFDTTPSDSPRSILYSVRFGLMLLFSILLVGPRAFMAAFLVLGFFIVQFGVSCFYGDFSALHFATLFTWVTEGIVAVQIAYAWECQRREVFESDEATVWIESRIVDCGLVIDGLVHRARSVSVRQQRSIARLLADDDAARLKGTRTHLPVDYPPSAVFKPMAAVVAVRLDMEDLAATTQMSQKQYLVGVVQMLTRAISHDAVRISSCGDLLMVGFGLLPMVDPIPAEWMEARRAATFSRLTLAEYDKVIDYLETENPDLRGNRGQPLREVVKLRIAIDFGEVHCCFEHRHDMCAPLKHRRLQLHAAGAPVRFSESLSLLTVPGATFVTGNVHARLASLYAFSDQRETTVQGHRLAYMTLGVPYQMNIQGQYEAQVRTRLSHLKQGLDVPDDLIDTIQNSVSLRSGYQQPGSPPTSVGQRTSGNAGRVVDSLAAGIGAGEANAGFASVPSMPTDLGRAESTVGGGGNSIASPSVLQAVDDMAAAAPSGERDKQGLPQFPGLPGPTPTSVMPAPGNTPRDATFAHQQQQMRFTRRQAAGSSRLSGEGNASDTVGGGGSGPDDTFDPMQQDEVLNELDTLDADDDMRVAELPLYFGPCGFFFSDELTEGDYRRVEHGGPMRFVAIVMPLWVVAVSAAFYLASRKADLHLWTFATWFAALAASLGNTWLLWPEYPGQWRLLLSFAGVFPAVSILLSVGLARLGDTTNPLHLTQPWLLMFAAHGMVAVAPTIVPVPLIAFVAGVVAWIVWAYRTQAEFADKPSADVVMDLLAALVATVYFAIFCIALRYRSRKLFARKACRRKAVAMWGIYIETMQSMLVALMPPSIGRSVNDLLRNSIGLKERFSDFTEECYHKSKRHVSDASVLVINIEPTADCDYPPEVELQVRRAVTSVLASHPETQPRSTHELFVAERGAGWVVMAGFSAQEQRAHHTSQFAREAILLDVAIAVSNHPALATVSVLMGIGSGELAGEFLGAQCSRFEASGKAVAVAITRQEEGLTHLERQVVQLLRPQS